MAENETDTNQTTVRESMKDKDGGIITNSIIPDATVKKWKMVLVTLKTSSFCTDNGINNMHCRLLSSMLYSFTALERMLVSISEEKYLYC